MKDHNINIDKEQDKTFSVVPISHWKWVLNQSPTVYRLWGQCWIADPFGNREVALITDLKGDNLRKAKKVLVDAGLFEFSPITDKLKPQKVLGWKVRNLFGSRIKYDKENANKSTNNIDNTLSSENPDTQTENPDTRTENPEVRLETLAEQGLQNSSLSYSITNSISNQEKEIKNKEKDIFEIKQPSSYYDVNSFCGDVVLVDGVEIPIEVKSRVFENMKKIQHQVNNIPVVDGYERSFMRLFVGNSSDTWKTSVLTWYVLKLLPNEKTYLESEIDRIKSEYKGNQKENKLTEFKCKFLSKHSTNVEMRFDLHSGLQI